jgi:lipopolysaccharide/colanic/teichoic acid biosynthesis glycosyltransferase
MMDLGLIIITAPLWLTLFVFTAILVKIECPGNSMFFLQRRTGKGGRQFSIFKFRTMVPDAEKIKKELMSFNELKWPDFKIQNDPRITKLGHFLRKTAIDELPQLINVLRGEMSLVGPRPTSFSVNTYDLWQTERLEATPGITGLWQIIGRGASEFDSRTRLDIIYIDKSCILLDFQILFRTVTALFEQRGIH